MNKAVLCKILAVVLIACIFSYAMPAIKHVSADVEEKIACTATIEDDFTDNKVLVILNRQASISSKVYEVADFSEYGCMNVEDLTFEATQVVQGRKQNNLVNVEKYKRILSLTLNQNSKQNVLNVIENIFKRDDVYYVGPNYKIKMTSYTPNDGYINDQWAINNLELPKAWDITAGSLDIKVGIIDTGIDYTHTELNFKLDTSLCMDFTYGTGVAGNHTDTSGHGTHVAGIIGAMGDNMYGIAGASFNVSLVSLKVSEGGPQGDTSEAVGRAINYAMRKNIPILNYSGGFGSNNANDNVFAYTAISNYNGLLICAAGNDGINIDSTPVLPATYNLNNIIAVGAYDENNEMCDFSNYGQSNVDIYAPGEHILSTFASSQCLTGFDEDYMKFNCSNGETIQFCELSQSVRQNITNYLNNNFSFEYINNNFSSLFKYHPEYYRSSEHYSNGYHYMDGTSMAAPYVTGVAALLLSINPNLTAQQLKTAILNSAETITITIPDGSTQNVKKLNAFRAVTKYTMDAYGNSLSLGNTFISHSESVDKTSLDYTEQNAMLKLNVQTAGNYSFGAISTNAINVSLYDDNFDEFSLTTWNLNDNCKIGFSKFLQAGTYYLNLSYNDDVSGTVSLTVTEVNHMHSYDYYNQYNADIHYKICECGRPETTESHTFTYTYKDGTGHNCTCNVCQYTHKAPHVFISNNLGYCIVCNHDVPILEGPGFGEVVHPGSINQMVTANGSYILPNGCIVLVPEDVEAYFNGTLVFYNPNQVPETA